MCIRDRYGADLSGTKGLIIPSEYIAQHFERVKDGYIGYKTFGGKFPPPVRWAIKPGEIITETVNPNRTDTVSYTHLDVYKRQGLLALNRRKLLSLTTRNISWPTSL